MQPHFNTNKIRVFQDHVLEPSNARQECDSQPHHNAGGLSQ
jgi:hypothetical protein